MTDIRDFTKSTSTATESPIPSKRTRFQSVPSFENAPNDHSQETFVMDSLPYRPRAMSHHLQSTKIPSRRVLKIRARILRSLMRLGMQFHAWTPPKPPKPDFIRHIKTNTISIDLFFYVPSNYHTIANTNPKHRYPIVVNFHGGGFTIGDPRDDRYYARSVLQYTKAVFVSVAYRRAPEHPFPCAVDDGVEALMYLSQHGTELRIDPSKTAISGFSAGGNLCFTVPFRLTFHTNPKRPRLFPGPGSYGPTPDISQTTTRETIHAMPDTDDEDEDLNPRAASAAKVDLKIAHDHTDSDQDSNKLNNCDSSPDSEVLSQAQANRGSKEDSTSQLLTPSSSSKPSRPTYMSRNTTASTLNPDRPTNLKILSIVAFYPLLDWTSSRSAKVRSSIKPELTLNKAFTDLFDFSYLPPPDHAGNHVSPFASPALAPDEMITDGLPQRMQLFLCEYDMLLAEGKKFTKRLEELGKTIDWEVIPGVPHGWDKSPNPFRDQKKIEDIYERAGKNLQAVFDEAELEPQNVKGERIGLGGLK